LPGGRCSHARFSFLERYRLVFKGLQLFMSFSLVGLTQL
jgi:hypothetical protein